jgi:hypothetical protein
VQHIAGSGGVFTHDLNAIDLQAYVQIMQQLVVVVVVVAAVAAAAAAGAAGGGGIEVATESATGVRHQSM